MDIHFTFPFLHFSGVFKKIFVKVSAFFDIISTKKYIYLEIPLKIGKKVDIHLSKNVLSEVNLPLKNVSSK